MSVKTQRRKAIIREWVLEAWNRGNVGIAYEIYSPGYVATDHEDPTIKILGPEGIAEYVKTFREAHPNIYLVVEDLIAEDDKVVGIFEVHGLTGADDEPAVFRAMDVWIFDDDDMITERRYIAPLSRIAEEE